MAFISILLQAAPAEVLSEQGKSIEVLQGQVDFLQLMVYVLIGVLAVIVVVAIYILKRLLILQANTDKEQNLRLRDLEKRLNERISSTTKDVARLNDSVETLKIDQTRVAQQTARQLQEKTKNGGYADMLNRQAASTTDLNSQSRQNPLSQQQATKLAEVVKFFSLQEMDDGHVGVLERRLVNDDTLAWFRMTINGNNATFEVNQKAVSNILADIPQMRNYTNQFDPLPGATGIKTLVPGRMRKEGKSWVVTDKVTIKLV